MLSCLFYICSSNFPIHIWNKAQQGKWKIIFDEQMSKCRLSRLENMWGLHLVLEGVPYLHIQFHEIFTTSNISRPWFSWHSPFFTTFAFFRRFSRRSPFFTTLEISCCFNLKIVIFFTILFHDIFTDLWNFTIFSWRLPTVVKHTSLQHIHITRCISWFLSVIRYRI